MPTRTIARMFNTVADAEAAIRDLEAAGFDETELSIIRGTNTTGTIAADRHDNTEVAPDAAATGASIGAVAGGAAGLLAALGTIAIPGIGPLVAAGWLVTTLAGAGTLALAGGLVGALVQTGIVESDAALYAEGVERGASLITVRTEAARASEAETILSRHASVDSTPRDERSGDEDWRPDTDGLPPDEPRDHLSRAATGGDVPLNNDDPETGRRGPVDQTPRRQG
ncbi:hypothetical protein [Plastoroseomonas arctica]|uniref:General stress protein 17M-like domain-containing protein n=1 Tax=Plastoroseomonas arctica TaxID=1509237 RepID=A0AAF1JYC3_9PROT|nr:hypothetical protein [Plastoroseomonas arctica]MBR0656822.1 hypothetical protein [Plastoroseomonas arctica]